MSNTKYIELAGKHGISAFTPLQEGAFGSDVTLDIDRNLFVIGETSAGKTLIPLILYEEALIKALENGLHLPKMLFVVPYRALAAQKKDEFNEFFKEYELEIVQSTGEYREHDNDIQEGVPDIAIIITEKAFKFQARDVSFLDKYDFLILDEVGLIESQERGAYFDFLFVWGSSTNLRLIALGTPFFNWENYLRFFDFTVISSSYSRPVNLIKNTIYFNKKMRCISEVEGDVDYIRRCIVWDEAWLKKLRMKFDFPAAKCFDLDSFCPVDEPCRNDPVLVCSKISSPCTTEFVLLPKKIAILRYLLLQICRYHLLKKEQVLIFFNNREEVVNICMFLYESLRCMPELAEFFPDPGSVEQCQKKILKECNLDTDDVYGILEFEDGTRIRNECYQALASGIAFHSAALPNELRTYVERQLLSSRTMKIVCSTETLAFGINSTVDAVVVADIRKQERGTVRLISKNEFNNYAGRAGRLRTGIDIAELKGTVYTLVPDPQKDAWNKNMEEQEQVLQSVFYINSDEKMPFFLINLIPYHLHDGIDFEELLTIASSMPRESSEEDNGFRDIVKESVRFLIDHDLLEKRKESNSKGRGRRRGSGGQITYILTPLANKLKGYILEKQDYVNLLEAVNNYVSSIYFEPDKVVFLYRLLCTKHASFALNAVYENSGTRIPFNLACEYIQKEETDDTINWPPKWMNKKNEKNIYVLAAMLAWCNGDSAKMIYKKYGMHYALLSRLAEQLAYLVDISAELILYCMEYRQQSIREKYQNILPEELLGSEDFITQCDEKIEGAKTLATSLYYGINTKIHKEIENYLIGEGEAGEKWMSRYRLRALKPDSAREFRRIVNAYQFFCRQKPKKWESETERNDFLSLRRQYYLEIHKNHPLIIKFFEEKFGSAFTGELKGEA